MRTKSFKFSTYDCLTVSHKIAAPGTTNVIKDRIDTIKGNDTIQVKRRLHAGGLFLTTLNMLNTNRIKRMLVETPP